MGLGHREQPKLSEVSVRPSSVIAQPALDLADDEGVVTTIVETAVEISERYDIQFE